MATYLTILEVEHEFLWIADRKAYLKDFVRNLFSKITDEKCLEEGSFCIPLDYVNAFTFKFQPKHKKPMKIRSYDVPIFVNEKVKQDYYEMV